MKNIVSFLLISWFISSCYVKPNPDLGIVYGKIGISKYKNGEERSTKELLKSVSLYLEGYDISSKIESNGVFYFLNVPPGMYRCKASLPGYRTNSCDSVEVSADSISLLYSIYFNKVDKNYMQDDERIKTWSRNKLKTVNLSRRGSIIGNLIDLRTGEILDRAVGVCFVNFPYCVSSTYSGHFEFEDFLPGLYNLRVKVVGYYETTITNILVVPDSLSIVNIPMVQEQGQLDTDPQIIWKPMYGKENN